MPLRVQVHLPTGTPQQVIDSELPSLWRYEPVLPIAMADAVSLVEGWTPLLKVDNKVWIKDESRNATGSFKARGMSMAVSAARMFGAKRLVVPSAGNAAGALAAYGARASLPVVVAMPDDTPQHFINECLHYGAAVHLVPGTISDAGAFLSTIIGPDDLNISTLKEPYRVEGKKTMGYELFEQFGGRLPDVIIYPTGGGTGLIGMWKAFEEMETMGWIGNGRPKLVSVQASGCAPVVRGFDDSAPRTTAWANPKTTAWGLRVPSPLGGFICLRAIRETNGTAVAVDEEELHNQTSKLSAATGIDICPEGGAAWAAYLRLRQESFIAADDDVVVFNTGTGLKYRN
jgi:threonine synthase